MLLHLAYTMYWMLAYHRRTVAALHLRIAGLEAASQPTPLPQEPPSASPKTLLVNQGKGLVPVATDQIAYIFVTNETSIVKTNDNQSYTIDATLEQLGERLAPSDFFRISRQCIVHRQAIRKVENDGSGRLSIQLVTRPSEETVVSRRRVAKFRQWLSES